MQFVEAQEVIVLLYMYIKIESMMMEVGEGRVECAERGGCVGSPIRFIKGT